MCGTVELSVLEKSGFCFSSCLSSTTLVTAKERCIANVVALVWVGKCTLFCFNLAIWISAIHPWLTISGTEWSYSFSFSANTIFIANPAVNILAPQIHKIFSISNNAKNWNKLRDYWRLSEAVDCCSLCSSMLLAYSETTLKFICL